jgi:hypothetical protein
LETFVPTPAKRPEPDRDSAAIEAILSVLNSPVATFAPGTAIGVAVYGSSGHIGKALLACVLGPPAVTAGRVLAEWVKLLEPSRRWRRPRRRGS